MSPETVPDRARNWWPLLFQPAIAHRGLWTPGGAPENSLAAFQDARDAGYGIELDVQLTADGEAVVFHDADLRRMTGAEGKVRDRTTVELKSLRLLGADQSIPTLTQTLADVGASTLVLVELKTPFGREGPLEQRVAEVLDQHPGPAAVIGFNPGSHAWFAEHRPEVARGLNSYAYADPRAGLPEATRTSLAAFEHVDVARPHFILPGLDILDTPPVAKLRSQGLPVIAWTVRTPEQRVHAAGLADNFISEGEGLC